MNPEHTSIRETHFPLSLEKLYSLTQILGRHDVLKIQEAQRWIHNDRSKVLRSQTNDWCLIESNEDSFSWATRSRYNLQHVMNTISSISRICTLHYRDLKDCSARRWESCSAQDSITYLDSQNSLHQSSCWSLLNEQKRRKNNLRAEFK